MVKKRTISGLLLCMFLLVSIAGCSNAEKSAATSAKVGNQTVEKANNQTGDQTAGKDNSSSQNSVATKQQPGSPNSNNPGQEMQRPSLFGQVKSVSGNNITIALAQMPERDATPPQNASEGQNDKATPSPGQNPPQNPEKNGCSTAYR